MLRSLCLLICLFASSLVAVGQNPSFSKQFWLGVKGGVHLSRYMFVPSVSQHQYLGRQGGLLMRLDLERGASAQIELNYVETGWRERFDEDKLRSERHLRYAELPLLTHLYITQGPIRFFVNAGPFLGYHLGDEHLAEGEAFNPQQQERQTMPIKYKFAWGLMAGAGISLNLAGRHRVELEARGGYNFQDIWGNSRVDPYGQSTEFRLGANLNYMFRF